LGRTVGGVDAWAPASAGASDRMEKVAVGGATLARPLAIWKPPTTTPPGML